MCLTGEPDAPRSGVRGYSWASSANLTHRQVLRRRRARRAGSGGGGVEARVADLDRFFTPRVVAVIGATDDPDSPAWMSWDQIRRWGEAHGAQVIPINPGRERVDDLTAYGSILDVPGEVDLVAILISKPEAVLPEIIEKKARFAVLFSAGFAETGDEGEARQRAIVEMLAGTDLRLLGPNTTLNAFQDFSPDVGGGKRVGLITQSGHQGRPLYQAQELGLGLKAWAPTGNEADLEAADFLRWFADQDDVGAVAAYIEGFKDGGALLRALDHAAARAVPFVCVKVGRTDVGRSWARSHSGHLAGSDQVTDAAFRQYGVTRVDTLDELADVSMLLARATPPRGNGLAIYSISGGTGAHAADLAAARGLELPELSEPTQGRLHELIAPFLRVSNPVDSGGHPTGDERGPRILEAILADPAVSLLLVPIPGAVPPISEKFAQDLVDAARGTDKPICVVWGSPVGTEPAYRDILLPSGLPVFRSLGNALTAIRAYFAWHRFRSSYVSALPPRAPHDARAAVAREVIGDGGALSEVTAKRLVNGYGIVMPREELCSSSDEAVAAAAEIGYPVVMKVVSPHLQHKTDLGLVALGVLDERGVRDTYDRLLGAVTGHVPPDSIEGVLVAEQLSGGTETILGLVRDELFGPTVVFGIGGVAVEVYRDVTFRVVPFTRAEAERMVREVRGLPLLTGARGRPAADLDALVDAVMAVQDLALDLGDDLVELDLNPLLARPDGVVALDALAVVRSASED
ncbi:MAG: acetate--CoA ligase family protein [Actinobacteria bacterium]|nr:acetate--CoA ligase family protein [Actinomycetota bacterium]